MTDCSRRDWLKYAGLSAAGCALSPSGSTAAESNGVIDIGSRRELMVDDLLVDRLDGSVRRRMHSPTPREEVLRFDKPWEGNSSFCNEVFRTEGGYQMFYRGWAYRYGENLAQAHSAMCCYAESRDGIHWERPNLGLTTFAGSRDNNIVQFPGKIGDYTTVPSTFTVTIDENPDCPADARYKGLVLVLEPRGLVPLQSPDGMRWTPVTEEPVITGDAFDSQNRLFWDPIRREYRVYYRYVTSGESGNGGTRGIKTAVSSDLISWTEGERLNYHDSRVVQMYDNGVFPYDRAPHLFVGFPQRYLDRGWSDSMRALPDREHREMRSRMMERLGTALTDTLLMTSRDGLNFNRFGEAFIRPGPERPGTWNYSHTYTSCPPVETASALPGAPDELSLYVTEDYWTGEPGSAVRRYTLRSDGFVSLRADGHGGEFVTKPLQFAGDQLSLNFSTSAAGGIHVEIQHPDGQPIEGYALQECPAIFGDSLDRTVVWQNSSDLKSLAGTPIRLRFTMQDADLYAFQVS